MVLLIQLYILEIVLRYDVNVDGVFNYVCFILFLGMVVKQFIDLVYEGDVECEEFCWKFNMLLLFKVKINNCNRIKYVYVVVKYFCLIKVVLIFRMVYKLKWGKYFNDIGRLGGCILIDQRVEYEVRDVKDYFDRFGMNFNEMSV